MKSPYYRPRGYPDGMYRVGPLARLNVCEQMGTPLADQDLAKIQRAGWDKVLFAWAGSIKPGEGHYYRVQGPTFLLEYDNTQNNANHIHSVWRDFENDFGEDLLRRHYQQTPHP